MTADSSPSRAHTITTLLLIGCVATWAFLAWNAPIDRVQGVIQKILYVHVPMAIGAYLGFICTAVGGALYLWKGDERWDRFALSSAEIGVLFAVMMLISGPIWGKGTWGKWWSWDLRLTVTLLLFFVYVAYLLLRSFTEGSERAARFAAVYGIAGMALIPLNYFAIKLAAGRSIHPENLGGRQPRRRNGLALLHGNGGDGRGLRLPAGAPPGGWQAACRSGPPIGPRQPGGSDVSYVIAAYGLTIAGIAGYALYLARERAALRRELADGEESNPG